MELNIDRNNVVAGLKQSLRAIRDGRAAEVFLALDAQAGLRTSVMQQCSQAGITPVEVPAMVQLGKACGINVGAAVAVSLRK